MNKDSSVTKLPTASAKAETASSTEEYPARGKHLLVTLTGCPASLLNNEQKMLELTQAAATATGATVLNLVSHSFSPHGVTALALLAESHASLHTYPETGVAFWDCFTCGDTCDPMHSIEVLRKELTPASVQSDLIFRR